MKIVDWEKSIGEKYWFKKESNINNLNLYLTEKKTRNLLGVLKRDNLIIYLSTQDNVHLTGVYSNIPQEFYKFHIMYLNSNFLKCQIIA